jgi:enoyl-CoA hydratase/carnithine racemase
MTEKRILAERVGRIGRLVLHRPAALNAIDTAMVREVQAVLDGWRDDPAVHAVVLEGADGRAFSAGADMRAVRAMALTGDAAGIETFFASQYALDLTVAEYPKPCVALIDGICMGGGLGLAAHARLRVTTEAGLFAMPETAIALFPDVGMTYFLPRLPGALGVWLGLTGARLEGADAVHAGFATHFVPRARLADLRAALAADGVAVLAGFAAPLPPFSLAPHRPAIDRCFGAATVAEILGRLSAENTPWAQEALARLRAASPSAVMWSHAALRRGAAQTLREALRSELALTRQVTRHPDLAEGVRAVLVDKDRRPAWSPSRLEEVEPATITAMLA